VHKSYVARPLRPRNTPIRVAQISDVLTDLFALKPVKIGITHPRAWSISTANHTIDAHVDIVVGLHTRIAERIETRMSNAND
jgi:hypothetical protein